MHIMAIGYNLPQGESQGLTKVISCFNKGFDRFGFIFRALLIEFLYQLPYNKKVDCY
jgi:hypothetical protein